MVVVDLEYTAWEGSLARGWSRPDEHREVVQIGAVRLDAGDGFTETGAFEALVAPQRNPELSDYFVDLTGITNQRLAAEGGELSAGLDALAAFAAGAPLLSNGADSAVIEENCALIAVANPVPPGLWVDIGPALQSLFGRERVTSADIPALLGLPVTGRAHDALADAHAIAAGLRHLRAQGKI